MRISDWSSDVCSSDLLDRRLGQDHCTIFARREQYLRLSARGDVAALVRGFQYDLNRGPAVFDRLACHATADDVEIPDEIELAQLDAIAFDPAIVAHPVGQEMRQPGKTHDRIIISAKIGSATCRERVCPYV